MPPPNVGRVSVEERSARRVFIPYRTVRAARAFIASRTSKGHVERYAEGPGYVTVFAATTPTGRTMVCGTRGTWRVGPSADALLGGRIEEETPT